MGAQQRCVLYLSWCSLWLSKFLSLFFFFLFHLVWFSCSKYFLFEWGSWSNQLSLFVCCCTPTPRTVPGSRCSMNTGWLNEWMNEEMALNKQTCTWYLSSDDSNFMGLTSSKWCWISVFITLSQCLALCLWRQVLMVSGTWTHYSSSFNAQQ